MKRQLRECPTGIKMQLDPLDKHPKIMNRHLVESVGLLAQILSGYFGEADTFKELAEFGYRQTAGYSPSWDHSGKTKISDDGTYQYPEDPTQYPLAELISETEHCFIYQYGFIAVKDGGKWITARLD